MDSENKNIRWTKFCGLGKKFQKWHFLGVILLYSDIDLQKYIYSGSPRVTAVPTYAVSRLQTRSIKWKMSLDTLPSWKTFTLMSRFTFHLIPRPVIASFKAYYLRRIIAMSLQAKTLYISCLYCYRASTVYLSCLYYSSFSTILLIFTLIHVVWNCFLFF